MTILIIGNGGRESAIADTIRRFHPDALIFVAPGNGGTAQKYVNVPIGVNQIEELVSFAKEKSVDLTIVGPEEPLVKGIVDAFEVAGLAIFGPNQTCSQFEGSKDFTKHFLNKYQVPTAAYETFTKDQKREALEALKNFSLPVVIKADGLAAGKGVLICESYEAATEAVEEIFGGKFHEAGDKIVIEAFLEGIEASLICLVDGKTIVPLETARDYKRALDGDGGLNTGGMGGFSPNPIITEEMSQTIRTRILDPIISGFREEGLDYKGILFIGLMIGNDGPKVLEFNVRFGDPETQSILSRLETDPIELFKACMTGKLGELEMKWNSRPSVTVVLASRGYPETSEKDVVIKGLDTVSANTYVYHAATAYKNGEIVTDGGRVMAVTKLGDTLESARVAVYEEVTKIKFEGMQFRTDIGKIE